MGSSRQLIEWPTLLVLLATYGAFAVTTTVLAEISLPIAILLTSFVIAQFSSLQHEVLHGHPFRSVWLSEASVFPGLTVFVPYIRFKDTHLAHHHDPILTDPYDDPESNFLDPKTWVRLPKAAQAILMFNNTLLGRILLGPAVSIHSFAGSDLAAIIRGDRHILLAWCLHAAGVAMVLAWLWVVGSMPVWAYVIAAYFGFGLLKIRTFLEHRAHDLARARSVVIEDKGLFALLFLNNNYHSVHHCHPGTAWYRLPALFRESRDQYLARNDGYFFASYREIFRKYFFRAKDPVPHPLWPLEDAVAGTAQANLRNVGTGPELSKKGTPASS